MPTKAQLEEQIAEMQEQIAEAKRQSTHIPVSVGSEDDNGSHAIDHLTILDNAEQPDTNKYPSEDLDDHNTADMSFWNNSWTWIRTDKSYGNKPEDRWFINPTPKLLGETLSNLPLVYKACRIQLETGHAIQQLKDEKARHELFLQEADSNELISESLDLLKAYQKRFVESVQRYIGICASYQNQVDAQKPDAERIEEAKLRKEAAGAQCRGWAAKLIALKTAYHAIVTDERAYNLTYDFSPKPGTREHGLLKYSVSNALNETGRRLARSIKSGNMDADKYRIPRPWLTEEQLGLQLNANEIMTDF